MSERYTPKTQSSETFFQKKEKKFENFEKAIEYAETIRAENQAVLDRLQQDVGTANDYMLDNGDQYASYRALRNYALSMIDKADTYQQALEKLRHDAPTEEQN